MNTTSTPATASVFARPAVLIGAAAALVALTALATTLVLRAPATPDASARDAASTPVLALGAQPPEAPADYPDKMAPAAPATPERASPAPAARRSTAKPAGSSPQLASVCASCGTVESVSAVTQKGEGTGLGVVGGAVVGGLLGGQVGGGNGKKVATVLGAVGGGMAGNEIEKRARASTQYQVRVRMDDGTRRTVTQGTAPAVGQKVTVEGSTLQLRPSSS